MIEKLIILAEKDKKYIYLLDKSLKISGNMMYEEKNNKIIKKFKEDFNFSLKNKIL